MQQCSKHLHGVPLVGRLFINTCHENQRTWIATSVPPLAGPRLGEAENTAMRLSTACDSTSSAAPAASTRTVTLTPVGWPRGRPGLRHLAFGRQPGRPWLHSIIDANSVARKAGSFTSLCNSTAKCQAVSSPHRTQCILHCATPADRLRPFWFPPGGAPPSAPLGSASSAGTTFARPPGSLQVTSYSSAFACRRDSQYTCSNTRGVGPLFLVLCLPYSVHILQQVRHALYACPACGRVVLSLHLAYQLPASTTMQAAPWNAAQLGC